MPDEVIGYLLYEAVALESEVDVTHRDRDSVRFRAILQDFVLNRNKRLYEREMLERAFAAPHIQELIKARAWYGEYDHPATKDLGRQSKIVRSNASHLMLDYDFYDDRIEATIETSNVGHGPALMKEILKGHKASFSMRGLGNIVKRAGYVEVKDPFKLITYDDVLIPSHKRAYQIGGILESTNESQEIITESSYDDYHGLIIPINASDFKEFYEMSENVSTIVEGFDILTSDSTVQLNENGDIIIAAKGGVTVKTMLEEHIVKKNSYREYLASLRA